MATVDTTISSICIFQQFLNFQFFGQVSPQKVMYGPSVHIFVVGSPYIAVVWVSELVLWVNELMFWVSELIPLYFGCLNLYFGCLNLHRLCWVSELILLGMRGPSILRTHEYGNTEGPSILV